MTHCVFSLFALHDTYFQRIAASNIPAILHCKMMQCSKEVSMFAIAVVFLVGTVALWLFGAIEG